LPLPPRPPPPGARASVNPQRFSHLDNLHPDRIQAAPIVDNAPPDPGSAANGTSQSFKMPPRPADAAAQVTERKKRVNMADEETVAASAPASTSTRPQKRKRDLADSNALAPAPMATAKKGKKSNFLTGLILPEWLSRGDGHDTPWCNEETSTDASHLWLHKEIKAFYDFVKPRDFERAMRQDLVDRITSALAKRFPDGMLYCFGSFAAGLFLPSSAHRTEHCPCTRM
jgi:non-canonical poly(A) RNA polymerase PAPD5/7